MIKKEKNVKNVDTANVDITDSPTVPKQKKNKMTVIQSIQSFSPIADIRDGIIITKDGNYIKIMEFSAINFLLRSEREQDNIAYDFAMALKTMPASVQFKILTKRADVNLFTSKIMEDYQTEKNEKCRKLQLEQMSLIRDVGLTQGVTRRFFLIIKYEKPSEMLKKPTFSDIKSQLYTAQMRISNMLDQCGNEILSTDDDEYVMSVLYAIMCRDESEKKTFRNRMIETVSRYMSDKDYFDNLDNFIPINDFICPSSIDTRRSPKYIIIDGVYYSFAFIPTNEYPFSAVSGWLALLVNMGEGIDVDFFVHKEPTPSTQVKIQYKLRNNKVKERHMDDTSGDYEELVAAINAGYYLKNGLANGDDFCYMATLITLTAHSLSELEWKMTEIRNFLRAHDLDMKPCYFQQEEAFLSSLPLCDCNKDIFKKSRRNILNSDLASAYPFVAYEVSDPDGILFGMNASNRSLAFVDPFNSRKYKNANMAILGTTGAGKTFTLQCLALRMRQKKIPVFIIAPEKGREFKRAAQAVGGQFITISAGSAQNINIMEIRKTNSQATELIDGDEGKNSILSNKIQQLQVFFSLLVPDITYEEKQLLDEALIKTYEAFGITEDNNTLIDPNNKKKYKKMPVLGDLYEQLKKMKEAKRLYNILNRYVNGSAKSFNKQTNVNLDNPYTVIDLGSLTKEMKPIGMFIALEYIWDKVREDITTRKAIFIDEIWTLIGANATADSATFVLNIFKLIRSFGGAAIAATQDINDFFALDNGTYGRAIINNSKTKFIMNLEDEEVQRVRSTLKLTEQEVHEITRFKTGEGLLAANSNHIIIDFKSSATERELIVTDRENSEKIYKEMVKEQKNKSNTKKTKERSKGQPRV